MMVSKRDKSKNKILQNISFCRDMLNLLQKGLGSDNLRTMQFAANQMHVMADWIDTVVDSLEDTHEA